MYLICIYYCEKIFKQTTVYWFFTDKLFQGSKRILEFANEIEELSYTCVCGASAKFSVRIDSRNRRSATSDCCVQNYFSFIRYKFD